MFNILVVEDSQVVGTLYASFLAKQGFDVEIASFQHEVAQLLEQRHIDLVICNVSLKTSDGIVIVETIRAQDDIAPIMAVSDSNDFRTKERAFTAGADDFMLKPVDLNEMLLRISALLRRARIASKQRIVIGNAVLDNTTMTVVDGSSSSVLPPKEFKLLFKLCASPDRIFTRADIMNDVWGIHTKSNERTVDVHVKRLRERFARSKSFKIVTVRGVGYKVTERTP